MSAEGEGCAAGGTRQCHVVVACGVVNSWLHILAVPPLPQMNRAFDMAQRLRPWRITQYLKSGPLGEGPVPSTQQVLEHALEFPDKYDYALLVLYYQFAETMFKQSPVGHCARFRRFVEPWIGQVDRDTSRFVRGALEAYEAAWGAGMGTLSLDATADQAKAVSDALAEIETTPGSIEELPVLLLRGQAESLWSRDVAGETFAAVRANPHKDLVRRTWDQGALSYFNDAQLANEIATGDSLDLDISWAQPAYTDNKNAFVISVDPVFFRIYGPMILFNAQQIHETDLVLLLCADENTVRELVDIAEEYLGVLSKFNNQPKPSTVSYYAVDTPTWVTEMHTYYACARFLALPSLLEHYESVYCLDADLLMRDDPAAFIKKTANLRLSVPRNEGTIGIVPWRRYMAGNLVANKTLLNTDLLEKLNSYISVGLKTPFAWTLDQNALSYVAEQASNSGIEPLNRFPRPTKVSKFMARWERNYKKHALANPAI